jgi:NADPH-dependent glutamate synthase beta subunit-like oxidoreductase
MLRYGIQEYRLPEEFVKRDIQEIVDLGVEVRTGVVLGRDLSIEGLKKEGFNAILLAVGLQSGRKPRVEGVDLSGVIGGLDFLKDVRLGRITSLKGRVLIIGGGNVAMDVALTALRLGAEDVQVACLEKKVEMPAFPWEIKQTLEEGVKIHNAYGVKRILGKDDKVVAVELMRCLSVFDKEGRFNPTFNEKQTMTIETNMLILAIGQTPDIPWRARDQIKISESGLIKVNPSTMETNIPGVFACGDIVKGPTSIVEAIASGKQTAFVIDKYLGGTGIFEDRFVEVEKPKPWLGKVGKFAYKRQVQMPCLPIEERKMSFVEVELGYNEEMAREEASRCLKCDLRLHIRRAPQPPQKWLLFNKENLKLVPEVEGVYQLLNENREVIYIKGTINLRRELGQQLATNIKAKYFVYEEVKMYTMRESELLQQYIKRHGKMPEQNMEIEEDLY